MMFSIMADVVVSITEQKKVNVAKSLTGQIINDYRRHTLGSLGF